MTLARLLLAALLFCSLPAFTQDQQSSAVQNRDTTAAFAMNHNSSAPSEPWRLMPNRSSDLTANSIDRMRVDQYVLDQGKGDLGSARSNEARTRTLVMGLNGPLDTDATCFTMRSYVVARDSKDSDSTHPAGYSTCQPASKYRLKTTQEEQVSSHR